MATISKRPAGDGKFSYQVKVRIRGYPQQSATFAKLTKARQWAQKVETEIREGRYFKTREAQRHTVGDLVDKYIRDVLPNKPKSKDKQEAQLKWWKARIGTTTLAEATPTLIAEQRDMLLNATNYRGRKNSPATVNRYLAALSHAFTIAVKEWGWVEDNPLRKVQRPTEARGRVRFLSDDTTDDHGRAVPGERTRLLAACRESEDRQLYCIVVLALSTGMRRGEILGLTWDRVNTKAGFILLEETKNGERRRVPLAGHALDVMKGHAKVRRMDTNLVFPHPANPAAPHDIYPGWYAALEAAEVEDFRFHDLRHSAASYLAMGGATMAEIAEVLGHKTLQMVKRYSHFSDSHTAAVVAKMNQRIFGEG